LETRDVRLVRLSVDGGEGLGRGVGDSRSLAPPQYEPPVSATRVLPALFSVAGRSLGSSRRD